MECNFDGKYRPADKGSDGKTPYTVTTLYYTCDSNVFQSSESSVQVVSASNYNATVGHSRPNFCELDIIAKKEKLKVNVDIVPLQTIAEELKSLPMSSQLRSSKTGFRKKIYHKTLGEKPEEPNEVLCLASVLKDDVAPFHPIPNRTKETDTSEIMTQTLSKQEDGSMVDEMCQTKKKRRSKSRRGKSENDGSERIETERASTRKRTDNGGVGQQIQAQESNAPIPQTQYADLVTAKTMYFAELPNTSAFIQDKPEGTTKETDKKRRKHRKSKSSKEKKSGKIEVPPEIMIVNKVENEFPAVSSPGSVTTIPSQAFKKNSDQSFGSLEVPKSTKTDVRRHDNSPNSRDTFLGDALRKYKTDTTVYRGKHRRKHRTSPKSSSGDEAAKEEGDRLETEVKVIYKVDESKPHERKEKKKDKKKREGRGKKGTSQKSASSKSRAVEDAKTLRKKRSKSRLKHDQEVVVDDEKPKDVEETEDKHDSILNLYQTNKPLRSESCTMITDEEYLKQAERRKRKSRKSTSLSKSKKDETPKAVAPEDPALLEKRKERKSTQRSKSRATRDTSHKKRYKSKTRVSTEEAARELAKKISRKSASDLSKKDAENFDGHKSIEGVQNGAEPTQKKQHKKTKEKKDGINEAEKLPFDIREQTILQVTKERRKRSKSYVPTKEAREKPVVSSQSRIFDGNLRSSDSKISKRSIRSKASMCLVKSKSKQAICPRDKFLEELQKISSIQQVEESRKRFKVISRTIKSKMSDGSTGHSTDQSNLNKRLCGTQRFRAYMNAEKEKEAILKLPIFHKTGGESVKQEEKVTIEIEEKEIRHNYETSELEEGAVKEERSKRKKKIRRTVSRREVSFGHLNVSPLVDLYRRPSRNAFTKRIVDVAKATNPKSREPSLHSELVSEDTDISNKIEMMRRFTVFTVILGEKILEICTKTIGEDGRIMEGFTVSGTEPPKRLRSRDSRKDKIKLMAKVSKLHPSFHPPLEIVDGVMKMDAINEVAEEICEVPAEVDVHSKSVKNQLVQVEGQDDLPVKTPIFLKTKRKFVFAARKRSKSGTKKDASSTKMVASLKNAHTSTESQSNSDSVGETLEPKNSSLVTVDSLETAEQIPKQPKMLPKPDIKNSTRMNSAVKLMESSLQIIKEESQSTDSSSRRSRFIRPKPCVSEMKETQTDMLVDDIDKIKEVITYLYNSMDAKKAAVQESVSTVGECDGEAGQKLEPKHDSSTESSSYHEQFKNFVRNVTPKFCGIKKNPKPESLSRTCISIPTKSDSSTISKIPMRRQTTLGSIELETVNVSSSDRSSSSGDPKNVKTGKQPKNPKSSVRRRSSSADVLTSGYFEKYKSTQALIEEQRKKRAESADSTMRRRATTTLEPEFKSSTSVSDFSSVVISLKDDATPEVGLKRSDEKYVQCVLVADMTKELIDKNIGTITEDEKEKKVTPKQSNSLIAKVKSSLSFEKCNQKTSEDKIFEDKSLQTSVVKEEFRPSNQCKINVLYTDIPMKPPGKRKILDDLFRKVSSHSFIVSRRAPEKFECKRNDSNSIEKVNKLDRLRRIFANRNEHVLKDGILDYKLGDKRKKTHSKKCPESDYMNLIKLERHLEQVLGLYPSIFKAIRAQIDDSTVRKLDKKLKAESPELFTSYDTLATTIDTVTEYKNSEICERYPSFSESNLNRFNRYCESLNIPGQEYQLKQFIDSQNALRQCFRCQTNTNNKKKKIDVSEDRKIKRKEMNTTPYPHTDTTSASSKNPKTNPNLKAARKIFKNKARKRRSKVKNAPSGFSIFCSSSTSTSSDDNWSVQSPLYSITTPSLNFSALGRSQSSTSLMHNKPTQTKLTRSKSVIEMCSIGRVNRRLALKHLVEASQVMRDQHAKHDVLVVSVNSSCTVFATPSKFLSKVEKHLQKDESKHKSVKDATESENKKQIDEQSFHSLFFSDSNVMKSPNKIEKNTQRPFYIHKKKKSEASDDEFPDSLEVRAPIVSGPAAGDEEEDLGNFSADSLESKESHHKRALTKYTCDAPFKETRMDTSAPQSFFVFSSTIDYDRTAPPQPSKNEDGNQQQNRNVQIREVNVTKTTNSTEDTSKTLLSESGYESTKSKRTASIRNFFKKGGSLLDIFRNNSSKKSSKSDDSKNLTNFSDLWKRNHHQEEATEEDDRSPCRSENTVYWTTIKRDSSPKKNQTTTFGEIATSSRSSHRDKSASPHRSSKGSHHTSHNKKCPCSDPAKSYQRQMDECHAYAEKVLLESQMRREGYYKQYQEFKEIPLELLIGKRIPNKYKYSQEVSVLTKPKCRPISTQSRRHTRGKGVDATSPLGTRQNVGVKTDDSRHDIVVLRGDSPPKRNPNEEIKITEDSNPLRPDIQVFVGESRVRMSDKEIPPQHHEPSYQAEGTSPEIPSKPSLKMTNRNFGRMVVRPSLSLQNFLLKSYSSVRPKKDQSTSVHISRKDRSISKEIRPAETSAVKEIITRYSRGSSKSSSKSSKSRAEHVRKGCTCEGPPVIPPDIPHPKLHSPPPEPEPEPLPRPVEEPTPPEIPPPLLEPEPSLLIEDEIPDFEIPPEEAALPVPILIDDLSSSSSSSSSMLQSKESMTDHFFIDLLVNDIIDQAVYMSEKKTSVVLPPPTEIEKQTHRPSIVSDAVDEIGDEEVCRRSSEDFRKGLTDKEVFDKLLNSFEKEDEIATRLSKDEEFFKDQIKTIKKDSDESIEEERTTGPDPNDVIYSEDPMGGKHRSTHFWEEKMKAMRAKEENPVKEDDIGTCFSRGFRPDNIALSGDACFSLNKQDRLKFSKGMLTNEESIIDFSERETPLDFLLALGFMVDEASNALKDEDIRSRLLAAITEARVWINKITTTQGTLLYLVAYKSRPKTMRYFLQLVEAIINKRINNAIKLDGFLRVLEKVEEGEIQMINILGADKFEDEENEEKIVKKQLRQLFITVYKIAEKEAMMKGKQLSQQAIVLLRILAAKYRAGLHPHLELIARYIGQELLNTETQLEAAMIFLSRLDTAEVKLKEFEAYCDIKCDKRKKKNIDRLDTALQQSIPSEEPEHRKGGLIRIGSSLPVKSATRINEEEKIDDQQPTKSTKSTKSGKSNKSKKSKG